MIKHNKKRNAGIVYEQLLSVVTRLVANNLHEEAGYVVNLMKKYYNSNTELGKEKRLFDSLSETSGYSEIEANNLLKETLEQAKLINEEKLKQEKKSLIQEISRELDNDLFNIPLKEYKLLASIQTLFNEERNNFKYTVPKERMKIRKTITNKLTESLNEEVVEEIDNFTFKVLIEKYNKKYEKLLNEDQKYLLKAWFDYLMDGDGDLLKESLSKKINQIKLVINSNINLHESKEYGPMLKEAYSKICSIDDVKIDEEFVFEVMRFMDVCEELDIINKENINA